MSNLKSTACHVLLVLAVTITGLLPIVAEAQTSSPSKPRPDFPPFTQVREGYEPVPVSGPREAAGLEPDLRPVAILADNLVPNNHLSHLVGLRNGGGTDCPLVLVSSGNGKLERENARARRLGARGAWCDPFLPPDLNRILQHASHP